jgi:D-aminoacyl-tRNA deacylase
MRALVQRVSQAAVDVEGERVAQIGPGVLILLGVARGDEAGDADRLADKVRALRIFDDAEGRMNEPLGERRPGDAASGDRAR